MKSKNGFTLVEIMIVVVIIGLLAAMAVPTWQKIRLRSQNETILNNLRQLSSAAQQYFLENGESSVASADLVGTDDGKYIKSLSTVRGEAYPSPINSSDAKITATSPEGDISYLPDP